VLLTTGLDDDVTPHACGRLKQLPASVKATYQGSGW